jgi:hypothetical protein
VHGGEWRNRCGGAREAGKSGGVPRAGLSVRVTGVVAGIAAGTGVQTGSPFGPPSNMNTNAEKLADPQGRD